MSSSAITGPVLSDVRRAPSGTAAAPSFAFNDSTGTGVYLVSPGVLGLSTAGVQRVVVDASGNVGVGVTPSAYNAGPAIDLGTRGGLAYYESLGAFVALSNNTYWNSGYKYKTTAAAGQMNIGADGSFTWFTAPSGTAGNAISFSERMRIDAGGRLLVNLTSPLQPSGNDNVAKLQVDGYISAKGGFVTRAGVNGASANIFNINWTGSPQLWIDSTNVGTLAFTSDYRVKKNIETQEQPALERIAKLRPVKYELADYKELFKADGVQREGFIAHELQEVIPSAVEGEKDAEDQIQSLKLDALCSVMVKAIQEQQEIIEKLEARLAALEAK